MNALSAAELGILDWVVSHLRTDWLDALLPWITRLGDSGFIWIAVSILLLLLGRKEQPYGIQIALALLLSLLLCNLILKNAVDRIRPFLLNPMTELIIPAPTDPSFPSGHTSAAFASATVLLLNRHRGRFAALILAVLMAFSRIYLYVHFPTDVLGGILLGILCGFLSVALWNRLLEPRIPYYASEKNDPDCSS